MDRTTLAANDTAAILPDTGATLADLQAAVALGAIPADTVVMPVQAAAEAAVKAARDAVASTAVADVASAPVLPADRHDCGIPGCRHGDAHGRPSQPDRQVKLECSSCGAVARMTAAAMARAGGPPACHCNGQPMVPGARRQYHRRGA